jgi:hypothetical protein
LIKDQVDEERTTEGLVMTDEARLLLQVAAVVFVVSAVLGIGVNWPRSYEEALPTELQQIIEDDDAWQAPLAEGYQVVAETQNKILAAARRANRIKAGFLTAAMVAEVVAVLAVALALILVVRTQ